MSWIKRFLKSTVSRDAFFIALNTIILLVVCNFIFVYFSPYIVSSLPSNVIRSISSCYRTFYHFDLSSVSSDSSVEVIFGDSYSEGMGDEFREGNERYGIFKKLPPNLVDEKYIIYGRSGFGNQSTLLEAKFCEPLLNQYTSMSYSRDRVERVTFVFYEGNDLDNNIGEINNVETNERYIPRGVAFFIPLIDYLSENIRDLIREISQRLEKFSRNEEFAPSVRYDFPQTHNGILVRGYPQAAALELTPEELDNALTALENVLRDIKIKYKNAALQFLYLPSVASSYEFDGELPVRSYKGKTPFLSTGMKNKDRHDYLVEKIESLVERVGWKFCDATEDIRAITATGVPVHGPKDWQHFNSEGYGSVAQSYLSCFDRE